MISVDTIAKVRRAHFVDKKKIKAIARELRLSRNTVRSIVRAEEETDRRYERREQPMPQLGPYVTTLEALLAANVKRPKRERLTYQRMFDELRLEGYRGGYDNVRRYARVWAEREGERTAEAYVPLSFEPGEAYQFDWSHECVVIGGVTMMAKVAQVRLCHSRMLFVRAYPRESQEMVFDAHEKAFQFFKGVPKRGIVMSQTCLRHDQHDDGGRRRFHRQGARVQPALPAADEPPPRRADGVHTSGGMGERAGREPGRLREEAAVLAALEVRELR